MTYTNILGVNVSAINMDLALITIDNWIQSAEAHYVCVTGVHGVMESQQDISLRQIHNEAGMVTPDGMPLVWLSKLYGHYHVRRVYGPDLMLAVCDHSIAKGYRHYLFGSSDKVLENLKQNLTSRFPGLQIVGEFSPPFRQITQDEDEQIVHQINQTLPDIVWVGLSTPKQERWMAAHIGRVNASVLVGVGAAFDFHAGMKRQAPNWMQGSGLEWLFRLATEPKRLAGRYLKNNPKFLLLITAQLLGLKR